MSARLLCTSSQRSGSRSTITCQSLSTTQPTDEHTKPYPGCMPWHPCSFAICIILSPSRYAEGSPRLTAYGELKACCDRASGSVKRVVVRTPYSEAVRPTRLADYVSTKSIPQYTGEAHSAISPRFAISTDVRGFVVCVAVEL
jgi:hypothetical protein